VPKIGQGKGKGKAKQTGAVMHAQMKKKQPEEESREPKDPSGGGSFDANGDDPDGDDDNIYDRVAQLYLHEMPLDDLHFPYMATQELLMIHLYVICCLEMGRSINVGQTIKGID